MAEMSDYLMVAAIDFGTTYSGFAFSMTNTPDTIMMNKNWGAELSHESYKTPTCVLTGNRGNFEAFGFEAESRYGDINEEGHDYQLYKNFKMLLFDNNKLGLSTLIKSVAGHERHAIEIFQMCIAYLKDRVLERVHELQGDIKEHQIKWVITLPAIWKEDAKKFMREAAFRAKLIPERESTNLVIALEPEAASLYCRTLDVKHFVDGKRSGSTKFEEGKVYMIIDAGGGTVDITVHKVLADNKVQEIHFPSGGPWGSKHVDDNFRHLLSQVLTEKFVSEYKKQYPQKYLELMLKFERVKRNVKPGATAKINIQLDYQMDLAYRSIMGGSLVETIVQYGAENGLVTFKNGALVLLSNAIESIFMPVIKDIVDHVKYLMSLPALSECKHFVLVGGFSDCALLQNAISEAFPNIKTLVPKEAQLAVIKGAVLFGQTPQAISSRIAQRTYGIQVSEEFNSSIHHNQKPIVKNQKHYVTNVFSPFIKKGETCEYGQTFCRNFTPAEPDQTSIQTNFYSVNRPVATNDSNNKTYVDDDDMEKVGCFRIEMPDTTGGTNRRAELTILYGGTEIQATGIDKTTGKKFSTTIEFSTL